MEYLEIILAAAGAAAGGVATAMSLVWKQLVEARKRNDYLADTLVDLVERDIEAFQDLKNAIEKQTNSFPTLHQ